MYSRTLAASGVENETFVLDGITSNSDADRPSYVATNFIDVYVRRADSGGEWKKWNNDPNGVFINQKNDESVFQTELVSMYGPTDEYYTAYLNESKTYEIKFGNGVIGSKLKEGDLIQVFYLDTNGPDGEIDLTDIDFKGMEFRQCDFASQLSDEERRQILDISDSVNDKDLLLKKQESPDVYALTAGNYHIGKFVAEESVENIREQAPQWFKTGSRLVTRKDYEYYIKNVVYVRDNIPSLTV